MRIFKMHLPRFASFMLLGGIPIHADTADAPRTVGVPLEDSVIQDRHGFLRPGDTGPLLAMGLRMDKGYAQRHLQPRVTGTVSQYANPIHAAVVEKSRTTAVQIDDSAIQESYLYRLPGDVELLRAAGLRLDEDFLQQRFRRDVAETGNRYTDPIRAVIESGSRPVKVLLGASVIHDSNVLRLPRAVDAQSTVGVPSRADTISVAYAGVRVEKDYAQQRVELEVTETAYRYSRFSSLNFEALEYRGALQGHLTPRWSGTLSTERRIALASSADTQIAQRTQRNLRTSDDYRAAVDGSLGGGWHAIVGVFLHQLKYDQGFLPQNSSRTRGAEAGVKYERASGSAVSLIQRQIHGEYLNRVADAATFSDDAFRQKETELKLDWSASGKSVVRGRLSWLEVYHQHFAQRDFSGLTGELGYGWTPTGKLRIDVVARRDLSPWWQPFSSYKVDNSLSITPTWQVGAKTSVRARLERMHSDFRGPVFPPVGALRNDTVSSAQLGMEWSPSRSLAVDASVQRHWRSSNTPGVEFDATTVNVNAKLKF